MNYFIEGLQGSGKSTLSRKIAEMKPGCAAVGEGDYSPVELAWCAYMDESTYLEELDKHPDMRAAIEEQTFSEGDKRIVCYTKIKADAPEFYRDFEKYEIYNGRVPFDEFASILLSRYKAWDRDNGIFECSLFQNTVEDMILFRCASDEEILALYRRIRAALEKKEYRILYLKTEDIGANLEVIRKERSDDEGNELWFPMMLGYFNNSPYAKANGLRGEDDLTEHFRHRQDLELRICTEVFADRFSVLPSKNYTEASLAAL